MVGKNIVPVVALARDAPVRCCLFVVCPLVLAAAQLLNSYVNGLTPLASVPFAVAMTAYAVLIARHTHSALRLNRLEGEVPEVGSPRYGGRF